MPNVSRLDHSSLVTQAIAEMKRQGTKNFHADHIAGYPKPEQIGAYIPDTTGDHNGHFVITEAESQDGLALPHTAEQFQTFYRKANSVGGVFVAVVNIADEASARALVRRVCGAAKNALVWTF